MKRVSKGKVFVLAGLLAAMADAPFAWGHGEHDWIRRNGYKSHGGVPCCGVDDCYRLTSQQVSIRGAMYRLIPLGVSFPMNRTLPSQDRYFWVCVDEWEIRCFFAPIQLMSWREPLGATARLGRAGH